MTTHVEDARDETREEPASGPGRLLRRRPTTVVKELDGGHILYLENLTVSFDGFKALNALTLYVDIGELRCIIGPNGAGKTTMMDVITGKTRPDSGTAWFGRSVNLLHPVRARDRAGRYRAKVPEADGL